LEKDLVPLLDVPKKSAYEINHKLPEIEKGSEFILECLNLGYQEPLKILENFKKYNFLIDESVSKCIR